MHIKMQELLDEKLSENSQNFVTYFNGGEKIEKSFKTVAGDIDLLLERLYYLCTIKKIETIAIIGNVSYDWMITDLACIKGGFKSVAIPEVFTFEQAKSAIRESGADILLLDYQLKSIFSDLELVVPIYLIASANPEDSIHKTPRQKSIHKPNIREVYSICFSSGTSESPKSINLSFRNIPPKKGFTNIVDKVVGVIKYKTSFWSRKDNKIIIFMPLSHFQQRSFIFQALLLNINIVLSDSSNCLKHLITEKPNIMVSVPVFYETIARRIQTKIGQFSNIKRHAHLWFNMFRLNRLSNGNLLKMVFSKFIYSDIAKIYGGRADYFVTGSAAADPNTIKIFYSVGVKVFEAYGQTETQIISMNAEKNFKIGSVGKPHIDIKIASDSEILVKYDEDRFSHNRSILNIGTDGFIHTGDLGYLDKNKYLFLTGRKDDVIVLDNGKKIHPGEIERHILKSHIINYALIFLNASGTLSLIVSPASNQDVEPVILGIVKSWNEQVPSYSRIKYLLVAPSPFSINDGLLTATLKMKRKSIVNKFSSESFSSLAHVDGY